MHDLTAVGVKVRFLSIRFFGFMHESVHVASLNNSALSFCSKWVKSVS